MKLYMKQKVFSIRDRFYIKDENEIDRYYVEGEIFTLGKKLHLYDMNGNELAYIQQKIFTLLPKFQVFMKGVEVAEIKKELTFFHPKYQIEGLKWNAEGDLWEHNYYVKSGFQTVAYVHKVWLSWGDSFELDIRDEQDVPMTLAVVLAIDAVMDAEEAAACS